MIVVVRFINLQAAAIHQADSKAIGQTEVLSQLELFETPKFLPQLDPAQDAPK